MNSFMIKDAQGNGIALSELNKEAAKFWNKEIIDNRYVHPYPPTIPNGDSDKDRKIALNTDVENNISWNWKQQIGWTIANLDDHTSGWSAVAEQLIRDAIINAVLFEDNDGKLDLLKLDITEDKEGITAKSSTFGLYFLDKSLKKYKPFIDLINYFNEKGYIPVQIKD